MTTKAQEIINTELRDKTGILEISNCGLTEIPSEVYEMDWLEVLNIGNGLTWKDGRFQNLAPNTDKGQRNELNTIPDFSKLTKLKSLCVNNAYFINRVGVNLDWLATCSQIEYFDASDCNFKNYRGLEFLTEVKYMDLSLNFNVNAFFISQLSTLKVLKLNNCMLKKMKFVKGLVNLIDLKLENNEIIKIESLELFNKLETINLSYNRLTKIENLEKLMNLKTLSIYNNRLTKIENLEKLMNLKTLRIYNNRIAKIENLEKLFRLKSLNISNNRISKLENLGNLLNLEILNVSHNRISKLENLENLLSLKILNISETRITKLENLEKLLSLNSFNVSHNKICKMEKLDNLMFLTSFNISNNRISKIENLENLLSLKTLSIYNNRISKLENLENLLSLENLNISENRITKLENLENLLSLESLNVGLNKISKLENIENLENLKSFNLSSNDLTSLHNLEKLSALNYLNINNNPLEDIDPNIFKYYDNNLPIYKTWHAECKDGVINNYYKICLLGNGRVGKSSLLDRLERNTFDPQKNSTHAVILEQSKVMTKLDGSDIQVQFWDFGGQDIYHGVHKWFLQGSHLNLLVYDKSKLDDYTAMGDIYHSLDHWLKTCKSYNKRNPIFLIQSKTENEGIFIPEDYVNLKKEYGLNNDIVHIDSAVESTDANGFVNLKRTIKDYLKKIPNSQNIIPASYDKVRTAILVLAKTQREMDYTSFEDLCRENGVGQFFDFEQSVQLCLRWLSVSGVVFYNERILSSRIILDQRWAINAMYKALERKSTLFKKLEKNQGRFLLSDLYAELDFYEDSATKEKIAYTDYDRQMVLSYMVSVYIIFEQDYNYYKKPEERNFICPQFLPDDLGDQHIIAKQKLITEKPFVTISTNDIHPSFFKDFISKIGTKHNINNDFLSKTSFKVDDDIAIVYKDNALHFYGQLKNERLRTDINEGLKVFNLHQAFEKSIQAEYGNIENSIKTIRIFISYAHKYAESSIIFVEKLKSFLSQSKDYKVEISWDVDIFLGEKWHERIQAEIAKSDMSILLLCDAFFDSNYISNHELNVFIERQRDTGYPFIPIYFSPCEFKDWESIKESQIFKPDSNEFDDVNSKDLAFTSLLYRGPTLIDGAELSPNVNRYFKLLRGKLEEVFVNLNM